MCTVTYVPFENGDFILTSSRDVPYSRKPADAPKTEMQEGIAVHFPKDGEAGGSWIGYSSRERLICLLNGGFQDHVAQEKYRKSRGHVVIELLKVEDINLGLKEIDLLDIEPFTLVIVEWDFKLFAFEFVWDGEQKHFRILPQKPAIWSSSTLYTDEVKAKREKWFKDWRKGNTLNRENLLSFHRTAGEGNPESDVLMSRKGGGTVSITSVEKSDNAIDMQYIPIDEVRSKK
ncbi:NRDE family protein [Namhaeicola litoreus]|uniref:NRDE family protein n=1 Tax=Namhaeicola litoreus TaxID=1052145 RepID=A0ABW3Y1K0_9FLAO